MLWNRKYHRFFLLSYINEASIKARRGFGVFAFLLLLSLYGSHPQQAALATSTNAPAATDTSRANNAEANSAEASSSETDEETDEEILVIHSYHSNLSWTKALQQGVDEGFHPSVTIHHEFLDAKRYPELIHQKEFLDHIKKKYADTELSVLMVSDDPGMNLVLENWDEYFVGLPTVFMGVNNIQDVLLNTPWLTGVFENHSNAETILAATQQNNSDTVIIISDSTATGQSTLKRIQSQLAEEANPPKVIIAEDLVTSEIAEELHDYPDHWPIFLSGQLREDSKQGALVAFEQEATILHAQVPNPLYANNITRVGYGAVGGKLLDGHYHAQQAVQLVQQILAGTPVDSIEPIVKAKNQWIFDAQALELANIDPSALPEESVLINVKLSFYRQYRSLVWGSLAIFSLGAIAIIILTYAIRRQKRAEQLLKENERLLENRVSERTAALTNTLEKLQQTQSQLIQTEKMSSLGQLVGGVAHELNNPLNFFAGNVTCLEKYVGDLFYVIDLYKTQPEPDASVTESIEDIELDFIQEDVPKVFKSIIGGAERIQKIVSSLQAFSRSDEQGIKLTDINQSLENTLQILSTQLSKDIQVHKDYATLPEIICNPGEINQVFLSILVNAIDAMKTANTPTKQIFISSLISDNDFVQILIADTGPGIPTEIQSKVFDPFFTTKPIGSATGLGLSLAYQTIQAHQGNITLISDGETGTKVMIELPLKRSLT